MSGDTALLEIDLLNLCTMCRITDCWAEKYGYASTEEFIRDSQKKFSLVETGIVDQPNCRLLLLNVRVSRFTEFRLILSWGPS